MKEFYYREKELDNLKYKANFVLKEGQKATFLLDSENGFTNELLDLKEDNLLLIEGDEVIVK